MIIKCLFFLLTIYCVSIILHDFFASYCGYFVSRRRIHGFGANPPRAANVMYDNSQFYRYGIPDGIRCWCVSLIPRALPWATEPCRPMACIHWRHVSSRQHQPIDGCGRGLLTCRTDAMNRVPTGYKGKGYRALQTYGLHAITTNKPMETSVH